MRISELKNLVILTVFSFSSIASAQAELDENIIHISDLVIENGTIYTVNEAQPTANFIAVKDDRIIYVGNNRENIRTDSATRLIDLQGKTLTPGFIEGHGHIFSIGYSENEIDLKDISSYEGMVNNVHKGVAKAEPGEWVMSSGWHQEKWFGLPEDAVQGFPTHYKLSKISPNNPVALVHSSGHAALVNSKALETAGITKETVSSLNRQLKEEEGGEIIVDDRGNPTGILIEGAIDLVATHVPEGNETQNRRKHEEAFLAAQKKSLKNGITGFHHAGAYREDIEVLEKIKEKGQLDIRLYLMLAGGDKEQLKEWYKKGPQIDHNTHWLDIRAIKLWCDGALGSRGAWLLEPYSDRSGHLGHATIEMDFLEETAKKGIEHGFQVCSHAIGDRANREVLNIYQKTFEAYPELSRDHRFRIEHAQHLHPEDIDRFADLNVLASMQGIHLASDRPWAIDRLGEERIREGAYVWQKLMESGARIINGTDAPVETVDPLANFYASVSRKTLKGTPEGGYEPNQKMTRLQALKSYTINPAYGSFMEDDKGTIEVGKLADFTVFYKDIMTIPEEEILNTVVEMTIVGGEIKYKK
ncbi:amidohydrolase [Salinimicrobium xinjiangense]|uniref:amidohydrolase n=1 Tax=Salinimicrobium xinjiangense TaxID=438596 RepID=UPI000408E2EC|nr:amidohydrolase [Salinimicrobium xinjiangense]